MASANLTIIIKIWDKWIKDTYSLGGVSAFALVEIGTTMYLIDAKDYDGEDAR